MAQPGNTVHRLLEIVDNYGNPITGLSTGSFTVQAYSWGYAGSTMTAYSAAAVITSITSNLYDLAYVLPPAAGFYHFRIVPNNANYRSLTPNQWSGEVETQDLASIAALVVVPTASIASSANLGMTLPIECIAYRYRVINVKVVTQSGTPVDLTQYNNFALSIRSKDQQTTKWDCNDGHLLGVSGVPYGVTITGDSAGNLAIVFPESSSGPLYTTAATSKAYGLGDFVVPVTTNGWIYRCTTAGTSGGSAPTWPITLNGTVTDGTATWTAVTKPIWPGGSAAMALGAYVRPQTGTAAVLAQYWICTKAGLTGSSEPAWPASPAAGATITDGSAIYTYQSDWYGALISAGASGVSSLQLYYELVANFNFASDERTPIIASSNLLLSERQVGT